MIAILGRVDSCCVETSTACREMMEIYMVEYLRYLKNILKIIKQIGGSYPDKQTVEV